VVQGDEIVALNGRCPRDVIEWRWLTDEPEVDLEVRAVASSSPRGGEAGRRAARRRGVERGVRPGAHLRQPLRVLLHLPAAQGHAKSLYLKDDDYRLSFLYGNFTTLTRFTEADLERVVTERLSPLNVSIHATDPGALRMLKNPRGGMSLRWLRALLDHGIEVHGQIVLCPGLNDGRRSTTRSPACSTVPRARVDRRGAARPQPVQHRVGDAPAHTAEARRMRWSTACTTGRTSSCACSAGGWCSPPTSTT
jgi:hypothetical protein